MLLCYRRGSRGEILDKFAHCGQLLHKCHSVVQTIAPPSSFLSRTYNAADPRIYILPCQNVFGIPYSKCTTLTDTSLFSPATLAESFTIGGRCCCIGILCFPGDSRVIYTKSQPSKKKQVLRTFESTHGSSFHAPIDVPNGAPIGGPKWVQSVDRIVYTIQTKLSTEVGPMRQHLCVPSALTHAQAYRTTTPFHLAILALVLGAQSSSVQRDLQSSNSWYRRRC